mgnify:CR=1 FL=1
MKGYTKVSIKKLKAVIPQIEEEVAKKVKCRNLALRNFYDDYVDHHNAKRIKWGKKLQSFEEYSIHFGAETFFDTVMCHPHTHISAWDSVINKEKDKLKTLQNLIDSCCENSVLLDEEFAAYVAPYILNLENGNE